MYTVVLHLFYWSFRWGRWVIVGCYNGSRYKKVENHWSKKRFQTLQLWNIIALTHGTSNIQP